MPWRILTPEIVNLQHQTPFHNLEIWWFITYNFESQFPVLLQLSKLSFSINEPPNQMVKHFQQKSITHSLCSVFNSIKTCCSLACFQSPLLLKLHQIWWVKPKAKSLLLLITLEQAKCWPATQQTSDHLNFQASSYTASKVDEIIPTHKSNSKLVSEFHSTIFPYNLNFLFSTLQFVNNTWQYNKRDKCNNDNDNNLTELSFSDLSETKTHKLYFVRNWGLGFSPRASQPASQPALHTR
jgi:hypothetical protein